MSVPFLFLSSSHDLSPLLLILYPGQPGSAQGFFLLRDFFFFPAIVACLRVKLWLSGKRLAPFNRH